MAKKPKLPKLIKTKKKFKRILSLDMGSKNLAYGLTVSKKLIELGFITNTIQTLIDPAFLPCLISFELEFKTLLNKHKPNVVLLERFQNRGRFNGNSSEYLNIMIGIISSICLQNKIYIYLISASQWKNRWTKQNPQYAKTIMVNKRVKGKLVPAEKILRPLEGFYDSLKPFPDHMIDAHLQAVYLANLWDKNPYESWKPNQIQAFAKKWIKENKRGSKTKRKG
jgi:hypothetical protein